MALSMKADMVKIDNLIKLLIDKKMLKGIDFLTLKF